MYEIWIEESGKEIHRQTLSTGQFNLGRSKDNQIYLPYSGVSRQHLRLDVEENKVTVTDLGSTNGTRLNGQSLQPHRSTSWPLQDHLKIGGLTIHIRPLSPPDTGPAAGDEAGSLAMGTSEGSKPGVGMAYTVVSADATPQLTVLTSEPIIVGRDQSCAIRLAAANVAARHCLIQMDGGRVEVTNLDAFQPAELSGRRLQVGQPTEWPVNEALKIGDAQLYLTLRPAGETAYSADPGSISYRRTGHILRQPLVLLLLVGFGFICLAMGAVLAVQAARCRGLSASCLFAPFGSVAPGGDSILAQGRATPTLAPVVTNPAGPTPVPTVEFDIGAPTPTSVPVDCAPDTSSGVGWLELPFPYRGTDPIFGGSAEDFRRISQRSRFGGRINAFFDHEFPVYPPIFGGMEPDGKDQTLIVFNGVRSDDAYSQDSDSADWYSGHAGIDFAPADPRQATTPILAAAEGRLLRAEIGADDNHMVWLEHDPDGDGRYQYATLYFHLHPDQFFSAMINMEEGSPIQAGQRIGTMGTTGRSS
ncbi:MAG: FHA domain-containing protein, partial [Chloroflexota bacterium]